MALHAVEMTTMMRARLESFAVPLMQGTSLHLSLQALLILNAVVVVDMMLILKYAVAKTLQQLLLSRQLMVHTVAVEPPESLTPLLNFAAIILLSLSLKPMATTSAAGLLLSTPTLSFVVIM